MINGRKTIGMFISGISGSYQKALCESLHNTAKLYGCDTVFFNFVGMIGANYSGYGEGETNIFDVVPFDSFDGIIYDNNNVFLPNVRKVMHERLRRCKCPVISIGEPTEDFYEVRFDNVSPIAKMVDHFVEHHGFTRIGFMSGIKGHADAAERLRTFRRAMSSHGLSEDGVGVFHGDFWYNKASEAADFFFGKCEQLPQAIVCANDYMAIALIDELEARGISVPEDVCVSGYDDIEESSTHFPSISTSYKDQALLAQKIFEIFNTLFEGGTIERTHILPAQNVYRASCGCRPMTLDAALRKRNRSYYDNINMLYYIYDAESAMLEMSTLASVGQMEKTFERYSLNFGSYVKFFFFTYVDEDGKCSYEKEFSHPTDRVYPSVWIDRSGTSIRPENTIPTSQFLPEDTSDEPHCYYIMHVHLGNHCFGYSVVMMEGDAPFNEFYNIWTVNIAVSMESFLQRNNIRSLLADLEIESTHDRLTGLLNRKGFESMTAEGFGRIKNIPDAAVTVIMIDMDRLKYINDNFGHSEGDVALGALGGIISSSCGREDISGRTGGDEFYVVMFGRGREYAEETVRKIKEKISLFNRSSGKEYKIGASCGISSEKVRDIQDIETVLRHADEQMYIEKRAKHVQR